MCTRAQRHFRWLTRRPRSRGFKGKRGTAHVECRAGERGAANRHPNPTQWLCSGVSKLTAAHSSSRHCSYPLFGCFCGLWVFLWSQNRGCSHAGIDTLARRVSILQFETRETHKSTAVISIPRARRHPTPWGFIFPRVCYNRVTPHTCDAARHSVLVL